MNDTHKTKTMGGPRVARRHTLLLPALLLTACAFCRAAQAQSAPAPGDAGATLRLRVTVTNSRGEFVMGLDAKDFGVTLGDRPREVAYARVGDAPASVCILVDNSASVVTNRWPVDGRGLRAALARFLELGHKSNDYFVASVGTRPELLADWTRADGLDLSRVGFGESKGTTPLYDSILTALAKLKERPDGKRVVVVVSDGADTTSEHDLEETVEALVGEDVLVYAVGLFGGFGSIVPQEKAYAALDKLTSATGGKLFSPNDRKGFDAAFDAIAVELRHQYELGVRLGDEASVKGARRPLAVKVKVSSPSDRADLKRLRARTRRAYLSRP